jgi:hypothetical protein
MQNATAAPAIATAAVVAVAVRASAKSVGRKINE